MESESQLDANQIVLVARLRRLCATAAAKMIRESANLSLRDVGCFIAKKTGRAVPAPTLSRWERGECRAPASPESVAYAELLGELLEELALTEAALAPMPSALAPGPVRVAEVSG